MKQLFVCCALVITFSSLANAGGGDGGNPQLPIYKKGAGGNRSGGGIGIIQGQGSNGRALGGDGGGPKAETTRGADGN